MSVRGQRIPLGVLLLVALVAGLWALLAPRSFYDSFPGGSGLHWVSADGPYNRHLVSDVGSMYLALAALTVAALARPALARLAGVVWLVFSVPHWLYHSAHLGLYGTRDQVLNEVALVTVVLAAVLLCVPRDRWVGRRAPAAATAPAAPAAPRG
jgi:hypothetical protein